MKRLSLGVLVAVMFGMTIVAAVPGETLGTDKNQQPTTIRGCVEAGTEPDTFLLTRVTEVRPGKVRGDVVPTDTQGRDILYWLSSTKGLKVRDGQRVEVRGTIDPYDPTRAETKVSEDSSKRLDSTSQIKAGGQKVTVKSDTQPQVAPTTTGEALVKNSTTETRRVMYRLTVASIRTVEGSCR